MLGRGCESLLFQIRYLLIHCVLILIPIPIPIQIPIQISVERLRGIEGIGELSVRKLRIEGRVQGGGRGYGSLMSTMKSHYQNPVLISQVCQVCAFWLCGS